MTSTSATDRDCAPSFQQHQCYLTGDWLAYADVRISTDDLGFRQGVTAVERLRTYRGHPFQVDAHLNRWQQTVDSLQIDDLPDQSAISQLLVELIDRNFGWINCEGEVGVTIFATPGVGGESLPTFCLHLNRLDHKQNARRRQQGQPLVVTDVQQPNQNCWPRSIKVRSRIHYYLADTRAKQSSKDAVGVLVDADGSVTETSIANLAITRGGQIISPPSDSVLGGITQMFVESLAADQGIDWHKGTISPEQLHQAEEILLMGTDGGVWFANSIDGQSIGTGKSGEIYVALRNAFDQATVGKRSNF